MIEDNDLMYDNNMHRYILTKDYVQNELGTDLMMLLYDELDTNPTTLPDRILKRVSNQVYEYLRYKCKDYYYVRELIENNHEIHEAFKLCLQYQLESFILEGDKLVESTDIENSICARSKLVLDGYSLLQKRRPYTRGGFNNARSYIS